MDQLEAGANVMVEALGLDWVLTLGQARGVKVNDVLATTDTVSERGLTSGEARRIVENFGNTLEPGSVRLRSVLLAHEPAHVWIYQH